MSGKWFKVVSYGVRRDDQLLDMDEVGGIAHEHKPKLIIAGGTAYSRVWDFAALPRDRRCGRRLPDGRHGALSPASSPAACIPSPFPHAHVVTTTTHKTLRGPRGGMILTNDEDIAKKINSAVFPGLQGGPLMHVIAAKAVALRRGAAARVQGLRARTSSTTPGRWPTTLKSARLRHRLRRHRQPSDAGRPAPEERSPASVRRRRSAAPTSPATRTASRSIRRSRSSPPASASARRPAPRAASATPSSGRSAS